jgi:cell fate regulator YaaT (PSP1 superfamily)
MAKDQNLPLNPTKISGVCGRLLCCLGYENEAYCAIKASMPTLDEVVRTPMGVGKVVGQNILKETVTVQLENGAMVEQPASAVSSAGVGGMAPPPEVRRRRR